MLSQYCPHHATCPFYQNWAEYSNEKRVDVIIESVNGIPPSSRYQCLTMIALNDPEQGGVPIGKRLKERLSNPEKAGCSHLTLLNKLDKLIK